MKIRYAQPADALAIAGLTKLGFKQELLSAMIYGCDGIVSFLERQISIPIQIADTVFIVAENDGVVIGFVEFRIYYKSFFLNYIGISPQARKQGLATNLLGQAALMVRTKHHKKLSLDVFSDNVAANNWYEKLGFIAEFKAGWYKISQSDICEGINEEAKVSGYSQSSLCYNEFGFSQFTLTSAIGTYSIGMLGKDWFKVSQIELFSDASALYTLYLIDSSRSILGLFKENDHAKLPEGAVCFCRSIRMNIQLETFEKNIFSK